MINPLMLMAAKYGLTILMKSSEGKAKLRKIFQGEMFMRTILRILHQIFPKIILNFKLIVKSIIGPDNNFWRTLKH